MREASGDTLGERMHFAKGPRAVVIDDRDLARPTGRKPRMPRGRLTGPRGWQASDPVYELRPQVTPNPFLLPLSSSGRALGAPGGLIVVIASWGMEGVAPVVEPDFTVGAVLGRLWVFCGGRRRLPPCASPRPSRVTPGHRPA